MCRMGGLPHMPSASESSKGDRMVKRDSSHAGTCYLAVIYVHGQATFDCLVDVSEQFAISLTLSRTAWNRRAFSPIAPFFRFMNDDFEFPEITSLISFKSSCVNMNVSPRSITPVLRVSCVTSQNSNAPSGHASLKFCAIPVSFVASAPQRVPNKVY